jgi:hypothetical protein
MGLLLAAVGFWRNRGHIMTWAVIPFVVAHALIAHKEIRFLYPVVFPTIVMALYGLDTVLAAGLLEGGVATRWLRRCRGNLIPTERLASGDTLRGGVGQRMPARGVSIAISVLVTLAIATNALLLVARNALPAEEEIRCWRFLYDRARLEPLVLFSEKEDAFKIAFLETHFYRDDRLRTVVVDDAQSGMRQAASVSGGLWVSQDLAIAPPPDLSATLVYGYLTMRPQWWRFTRGHHRLYVWALTKRTDVLARAEP